MGDRQAGEPRNPAQMHSGYSRAFLEHLQRGELRFARCAHCGRVLAYAERVCGIHPRAGLEWVAASGLATLHALAVYRLSYSKERPAPYNVAVVELKEGPRLVSAVRSAAGAPPAVGSALRAAFSSEGLLVFEPA